MAGLKPQTYYNAIGQIYEETKTPPKNVVFAMDSDEAGESFVLEHINNKIEHHESGVTVQNHVASPRHQDFNQLGEPSHLESWKQVKDFNDILTNIDDTDVKMKYEPVVLEKDTYFKTIDYDKKYNKVIDELSQDNNSNQNISANTIANKIARYEYHKDDEKTKAKTKKKEADIEMHSSF